MPPIEDEEWFFDTERSERNLMEATFLSRLEDQYLGAFRERLSFDFVEGVLSAAVRRHATEYFSTQAALAAVPIPEPVIAPKATEAASPGPAPVPAPPVGGASSPRKAKAVENAANDRSVGTDQGSTTERPTTVPSESIPSKPAAPPPPPWSGTSTPQEKLFHFLYRLLSAYPRDASAPNTLDSAREILSTGMELVFPISTILDVARELGIRDGHTSPTVKVACGRLVELVMSASQQQRRAPTAALGGSIVWGKPTAQEAWVGGQPQAAREQNPSFEAYPLGGAAGVGSVESVVDMFGSGRSSRSTTRCSSRADRNSPVQYRPPSASCGHPLQFDSSPSRSRPISPLSSMSTTPYRTQEGLSATLSAEGLSGERTKLRKPTESYITARQVAAAFIAATVGVTDSTFVSLSAKFLRILLTAAPQTLSLQGAVRGLDLTRTATDCRSATLREAIQNLFSTLDLHGDRQIRLSHLRRLLSTVQSSGDVKVAGLADKQVQQLYEQVLSAICNDGVGTWGFSTVVRWIMEGFDVQGAERGAEVNLNQGIRFCGLLIQSFWTHLSLPQIGRLSTARTTISGVSSKAGDSYDVTAGQGSGVTARNSKVSTMASMIYMEFLKKEATLLQTIENVLRDIDEASLESLSTVWQFSLSGDQSKGGAGKGGLVHPSDVFQIPQLERFLQTANEWLGFTSVCSTPQTQSAVSLSSALFSSLSTCAGRRRFIELLRQGQHWWSGVPRSAAHSVLVGSLNGSLLWGETVVAKDKITRPELFRHWRFGLQCHVPLAAHSALFSLKHYVLAVAELATLRCGWNMKTSPKGTADQKPAHADPVPQQVPSPAAGGGAPLSTSSSSIALPCYRPLPSAEWDESLWISEPSLSLDTITLLASHQGPKPTAEEGVDGKLSLLQGIEEAETPSTTATLPSVAEDDPAAHYWAARRREQQKMLNVLMKERDVFNENHVLSMEQSAARALRPQTAPMQRKPQPSGERPQALLPTPPPGQRPQGPASPSSRR